MKVIKTFAILLPIVIEAIIWYNVHREFNKIKQTKISDIDSENETTATDDDGEKARQAMIDLYEKYYKGE